MAGDYTISDIYQGGYSSLTPSYGNVFTGYHVAAGELGMTTDPRTANQIQALGQTLNQGVIPVEVGVLSPEVFDQIPKQHFKEMNRIAKLAGAKISIHAPLVEPSGIDAEGRRPWDESHRELAEKQLKDVVDKAVDMDDKGGVPITIHAAGIPGTEYKMTPEGKKVERLIVINQETGKMAPIEEEKKFYPDARELRKGITEKDIIKYQEGKLKEKDLYTQISLEKGIIHTPEETLRILNNSEWDNSISQLIFNKERADEILQKNHLQINHLLSGLSEKKIDPNNLTHTQQQAYNHFRNAETYLEDTHQHLNSLFSKAYKYGTEKQKKELKKISEGFQKGLKEDPSPMGQSKAMQKLMIGLKQKKFTPKMYVPIEDFAVKKSAQTFANVAFRAYDKHKSKAPVISIENLYPGMAFSQGKEMNKLIIESKKKFVEKAVGKGYSKSTAEKQADKLIGVTLDVGHLNISRKKGFEDKDLLKEVEQITKHVKHIHMTDNFGYSDSHLPPGMGNVPIKKILETLEKKGVDLKKVRKINEVGGWFEHFKTSPYESILEAFGAPMRSTGEGAYWNQSIGLQQSYFGGYGEMLPNINYETFGAGFSQLPAELGGQRQGGAGGRMSGRPME
tara:strand:+ start:812 stop:2674 length:1863 start_codon:yes stop_codon:yes gene_type:complete